MMVNSTAVTADVQTYCHSIMQYVRTMHTYLAENLTKRTTGEHLSRNMNVF